MSNSQSEKKIDYIEFPTTSVAESRRFYNQVFGWPFKDQGPDYASFNDGRTRGGFQGGAGSAGRGPLVVIYAADLEAVKARIVEAGGSIVKEPFEFPGGKRFHFRDPGGNELAVWSEK